MHRREARLEARLQHLSKRDRKRMADKGLETRQWDYVEGDKNPLFDRMSESSRRDLLLECADAKHPYKDPSAVAAHECHAHDHHRRARARSSSFDTSSFVGHTEHDVFVERANASLKEFEVIRRSRRVGGGCGCEPISHPEKLPLQRLKDELQGRGLVHTGKKKDLVKILASALEGGMLCNNKVVGHWQMCCHSVTASLQLVLVDLITLTNTLTRALELAFLQDLRLRSQ
ncbi:unnamed protein product [Chrysoparadoxa australica]